MKGLNAGRLGFRHCIEGESRYGINVLTDMKG